MAQVNNEVDEAAQGSTIAAGGEGVRQYPAIDRCAGGKVERLVVCDPVFVYLVPMIINCELGDKTKWGNNCAR
jgi:hypothetical protein